MDKLTAELVRAVQETMQPEQVTLWLKSETVHSRNDFRNVYRRLHDILRTL